MILPNRYNYYLWTSANKISFVCIFYFNPFTTNNYPVLMEVHHSPISRRTKRNWRFCSKKINLLLIWNKFCTKHFILFLRLHWVAWKQSHNHVLITENKCQLFGWTNFGFFGPEMYLGIIFIYGFNFVAYQVGRSVIE